MQEHRGSRIHGDLTKTSSSNVRLHIQCVDVTLVSNRDNPFTGERRILTPLQEKISLFTPVKQIGCSEKDRHMLCILAKGALIGCLTVFGSVEFGFFVWPRWAKEFAGEPLLPSFGIMGLLFSLFYTTSFVIFGVPGYFAARRHIDLRRKLRVTLPLGGLLIAAGMAILCFKLMGGDGEEVVAGGVFGFIGGCSGFCILIDVPGNSSPCVASEKS